MESTPHHIACLQAMGITLYERVFTTSEFSYPWLDDLRNSTILNVTSIRPSTSSEVIYMSATGVLYIPQAVDSQAQLKRKIWQVLSVE